MAFTALTPLWLLDVDGVVNSIGEPPPEVQARYGSYEFAMVGGYPIWWSRKTVSFINEMHRRGLVEIWWLTTWTTDAPNLLAPTLGLEDFPAVEDRSGGAMCWRADWWKAQRAKELLIAGSSGRPLVWTDDDLNSAIIKFHQEEFSEEDWPTLFLTPQSLPGLRPKDLTSIENFLHSHQPLRK